MGKQHAYPPEYRAQMVELVKAGRTPEKLSREFEPTAQSIRNWVKQADLDEGRQKDGLTSTERDLLGGNARLPSQHRFLCARETTSVPVPCRRLMVWASY